MKKSFISVLCMALFYLTANAQSISGAIRKFDTAMLNAQIAKGETVISSINYADTMSCGSIVQWIQSEIKLAASQPQNPRLTIVPSNKLLPEEKNAVIATTRGAPFVKAKSLGVKKFVITGNYQQVKDKIELYLYLNSAEGESFSSAKVIIPMSEIEDRNLSLYPQNVEQAKVEFKDVKKAKSVAKTAPDKAITITAAMLDAENNMVNILHPGDKVGFEINCDKDSYIAIMGIDANSNQYWLPVKNNFMEANVARRFPDGDVDYKVVDGVFGAEVLFVYAATSVDVLPATEDGKKYQPNVITNTTRGFVATKKKKDTATGVFAIPYTVIAE